MSTSVRSGQSFKKYVSFHARQVPKPSRLTDGRFFAVHREEIERILEESNDDAEVRAAMLIVKAMLLRGAGRVDSRVVAR